VETQTATGLGEKVLGHIVPGNFSGNVANADLIGCPVEESGSVISN